MFTMKPKTLDPSSRGVAKRIVHLFLLCTNASLIFLKSPTFHSFSLFLSLLNYTLIYSLTNCNFFRLVLPRTQPALLRAALLVRSLITNYKQLVTTLKRNLPLSAPSGQSLNFPTLVNKYRTLRLFSQLYKCLQLLYVVSQQYTYTPLKLNFSLALPPPGRPT